MELKNLDLKSFFFIAILIFLGVVMSQLFSPFLNVIVLALVIVQLFHPVYKNVHRAIRNKGIASLLTGIITLVLVVIPIIFVILVATSEVTSIVDNVNKEGAAQSALHQQSLINTGDLGITPVLEPSPELTVSPAIGRIQTNLHGIIDGINGSFHSLGLGIELGKPNLGTLGYELLSGIQSNLVPLVSDLVSVSLNALFMMFLFIITLLYLFSEYEKLPRLLSRISPLDDDLDHLLFQKFTETTRAVIIGNFLVAIAQASAVSAMLLMLGVGAPVLLWVLMVILSLVPIGSGLVWLPVGLGLVLSGNPAGGILLIVYSAVIVNVIDTTLRPRLLRGTVRLHPLVIIFSALGGIGMFGPLGILYGPLIAVFFTSLMDVYTTRYAGSKLHHSL